MANRPS